MIEVPTAFADDIIRLGGDGARAWLSALPRVVEEYLERWGLVLDGEPMHGGLGVVVPVRRGTEACVLKISWADSTTRHETAALRAWDGAGAVRLLTADSLGDGLGDVPRDGPGEGPGEGRAGGDVDGGAAGAGQHVLLLERLDSSRSLADLPLDEAVQIVGALLARLSVPAPEAVPTLRDWAGEFVRTAHERAQRLGMGAHRLDAAVGLAARLGPSAGKALVHTDLHYENILAGEREPWLAIDPKVLAGDPEFAVGPMLWRRIPIAEGADPEDSVSYAAPVNAEAVPRRLDRLVVAAGLDSERAYGWALVRCVDYELWGRSVGLTMDPACCLALTEALLAAGAG